MHTVRMSEAGESEEIEAERPVVPKISSPCIIPARIIAIRTGSSPCAVMIVQKTPRLNVTRS